MLLCSVCFEYTRACSACSGLICAEVQQDIVRLKILLAYRSLCAASASCFCALKVCQPSVDFQKAVGRVPRVRRSRWGWRGHRGEIVLDLSVGADADEQRNQCEPTTHILVAACDCILLLVSSRLRLPRREQPHKPTSCDLVASNADAGYSKAGDRFCSILSHRGALFSAWLRNMSASRSKSNWTHYKLRLSPLPK